MKNRVRVVYLIISLIGGGALYNYTGDDITLESGEVIENIALTEHLTKTYKDRDLSVPLTIYLHHTATSKDASIEAINNIHLENDWPKVSYHFAVDDAGNIYYLNSLEKLTWHTKGKNSKGISIVMIGNYENYEPSDAMVQSVETIIEALCQLEFLNIVGIQGHRDVKATLCPGEHAYKRFEHLYN